MQAKRARIGLLAMLYLMATLVIDFSIRGEQVSAAEAVEVGDYVVFGSYNGQPLKWQIIKIDDNGLRLFLDRSLSAKAFDASGDYTDGRGDERRIDEGSNYWERSNLREWLNSTEEMVTYSHQPPNSYDTEPVFLSPVMPTMQSPLRKAIRIMIQPILRM